MPVQFAKFTYDEHETVGTIVRRAGRLSRKHALPPLDTVDLTLDVAAVHFHCPLKLRELASADDTDFVHDIYGIWRHLDRKTGRLKNCFLPRFAA